MIDAGADVVFIHGPHRLRGIELYKGKPIFYSLGDFIFQNETLLRYAIDNFEDLGIDPKLQPFEFNMIKYDNDKKGFPAKEKVWESVIALPYWEGKKLIKIELYPITLGFKQPISKRGRPILANNELAQKILNDIQTLSVPYGTNILIKKDVGYIFP